MPYVDRPSPRTGLDGKFSFQYTAAAALLDGAVTVRTFSEERRSRPDMIALLSRITLVQSPTIPGEMEKMWVEISVEHTDGRREMARCHGPKGFWGLPSLTRDEHLTKVRDCLGMRLSKEDSERCIQLVDSLDSLDHNGVCELITIASATGFGI
jgi:aconitate decarboxylase